MIANRDIATLAQVRPVMREIESIEERIAWQRERMTGITQRLTWTTGGSGRHGMDDGIARLTELEEDWKRLIETYRREIKSAQKVLESVMQPDMRVFVRMVYMDGCAKGEVMEAVGLTEWGYRRARECVESAECMAKVAWRSKYLKQNVEE